MQVLKYWIFQAVKCFRYRQVSVITRFSLRKFSMCFVVHCFVRYLQNPCCFSLKIRGKVKVNFTLERATKAQRGSRGIALLFL